MPKHRAKGETRGPIPVAPQQVKLFRARLDEYGTGDDGRVFRGLRSEVVSGETLRKVWARARGQALTEKERESPLAKRPYDLRHTCLSTLLNAGVAPKQVAEWAGHSVEVLLRTYAECLVGHTHVARRASPKLRGQRRRAECGSASRTGPGGCRGGHAPLARHGSYRVDVAWCGAVMFAHNWADLPVAKREASRLTSCPCCGGTALPQRRCPERCPIRPPGRNPLCWPSRYVPRHCQAVWRDALRYGSLAPSSSGLGRRPLKAVAPVQIRSGLLV